MKKSSSLKNSLKKYAFGQVLSIILATTGLINGYMSDKKNLNIPAIQAALTYTIILVGSLSYRFLVVKSDFMGSLMSLMRIHRKNIIGAVLFDIVANWFVVKAFSKLQLAEVMIFLGLSTPIAIFISWISTEPRPKYSKMQISGVTIALLAVLIYFFAWDGSSSDSIIGILFAVTSAIGYAASNNFQEKVAREMSPDEFLIGLGSIGSVVSWIISFGSWEEFINLNREIGSDSCVIGLVLFYALVLSSFYLLIPVYMSKHSAVSFNFSLLTANFFGIIGNWLILNEGVKTNWIYLSIILINFGLLIYYTGEESSSASKVEEKHPC